MAALFVNDGYTISGTIKARPGAWDTDLLVVFRPPVGDELDRLYAKTTNGNEFLASKIVSWSGGALDGVPVTAENFGRMWAVLWNAMMNLVCGYPVEDDLKN